MGRWRRYYPSLPPERRRLHPNYLMVRYEDLWNKPEEELRRIFAVVGLDADKYDFNAAINLPVRGSSTFHGKEEKRYHWKPVEKTADFDPFSRANHWSRSTHERFDWIAGEKLTSFGYVEREIQRKRLFWVAWNRTLDLWWQLRELSRSTIKLAKDALKWMFGADRMSRYRRQVVESQEHFQITNEKQGAKRMKRLAQSESMS